MQFSEKLWKMWENIRDIELATTERRRNYLVPEPNYHYYKVFCRTFVGYRNEKNSNIQEYTRIT